MNYTVNELAKISGVSVRTLHYYDEIGLLQPTRIETNQYRIYGSKEVDLLQQILFYRELGVPLKKITDILKSPDYNKEKILEEQLAELLIRKKQIDTLIINLEKTINKWKRGIIMNDNEKFEGFKQKIINDNETQYGKEIREKYGDNTIDSSNKKIQSMNEEQWKDSKELESLIKETLKEAFEIGDPGSEIAQMVCDLHRKWICMFWQEGTYSKDAHKALAEGYVLDERFTAYYDKVADGCTAFLRDAINIYCS